MSCSNILAGHTSLASPVVAGITHPAAFKKDLENISMLYQLMKPKDSEISAAEIKLLAETSSSEYYKLELAALNYSKEFKQVFSLIAHMDTHSSTKPFYRKKGLEMLARSTEHMDTAKRRQQSNSTTQNIVFLNTEKALLDIFEKYPGVVNFLALRIKPIIDLSRPFN